MFINDVIFLKGIGVRVLEILILQSKWFVCDVNWGRLPFDNLQMLHDVVDNYKMTPLLIVYEDEEEVVLWKDFVEADMSKNVLPPKFVRISTNDVDEKKL